MIQTDERKMLRALEKIAENTGRLYREAARLADAMTPVALEVQTCDSAEMPLPEIGKVTAEEALAAIKTIKAYCHQFDLTMCAHRCALKNWCVREKHYDPEDWCREEDADD